MRPCVGSSDSNSSGFVEVDQHFLWRNGPEANWLSWVIMDASIVIGKSRARNLHTIDTGRSYKTRCSSFPGSAWERTARERLPRSHFQAPPRSRRLEFSRSK